MIVLEKAPVRLVDVDLVLLGVIDKLTVLVNADGVLRILVVISVKVTVELTLAALSAV